jgi:hypothetical protein
VTDEVIAAYVERHSHDTSQDFKMEGEGSPEGNLPSVTPKAADFRRWSIHGWRALKNLTLDGENARLAAALRAYPDTCPLDRGREDEALT